MTTYKLPEVLDKAIHEVDSLAASDRSELELDFHAVRFISVEGLEWLEEVVLHAKSAQRNVRFINVQPEQYKVFKVARIANLLEACGASPLSGPTC